MKIIVMMKQVANKDAILRINKDATWIEEGDLSFEVSESDGYALEEALRVREKLGGEVVVCSMGPQRVKSVIKDALARGADRAIHVVGDNLARLTPFAAATVLADAIRDAVCATAVPEAVRAEIADRYAELGEPPVAVRSSAVGEDSAEATFAGQQESYLWVRGADAVCDAVRACWASTYSAPAMTYRARLAGRGAPEMGVAIQRMVADTKTSWMYANEKSWVWVASCVMPLSVSRSVGCSR